MNTSDEEIPPVTVKYLEQTGTPSVISPAPGILAIVSGDGRATVDMTYAQAVEVRKRLGMWL